MSRHIFCLHLPNDSKKRTLKDGVRLEMRNKADFTKNTRAGKDEVEMALFKIKLKI